MDTVPNTTWIALIEAQTAVAAAAVAGADLEVLIRTAMATTYRHGMCTNEDEQFKAAVGAVMNHYGAESEVFRKLEWELRQVARLSAVLSAADADVPIDWPALADDVSAYAPIGLMRLWRSVKAR